jgi:hypothetical protein
MPPLPLSLPLPFDCPQAWTAMPSRASNTPTFIEPRAEDLIDDSFREELKRIIAQSHAW